jgi:hypothetical protein
LSELEFVESLENRKMGRFEIPSPSRAKQGIVSNWTIYEAIKTEDPD